VLTGLSIPDGSVTPQRCVFIAGGAPSKLTMPNGDVYIGDSQMLLYEGEGGVVEFESYVESDINISGSWYIGDLVHNGSGNLILNACNGITSITSNLTERIEAVLCTGLQEINTTKCVYISVVSSNLSGSVIANILKNVAMSSNQEGQMFLSGNATYSDWTEQAKLDLEYITRSLVNGGLGWIVIYDF